MAHLDEVTWPPAPIATERLILRAAELRDREAMLDLFSDPQVNELERNEEWGAAQWFGAWLPRAVEQGVS